MRNKFFLIFSLLFVCASLSAQRMLYGTVYDRNNKPLIGVYLSVKEDKTLGAATDEHGRYTLHITQDKDYTVVISYVGYITQYYHLDKESGSSMEKNFYLEEEDNMLGEVVITGTRTPKLLKDAPIVTRVISADDIKKIDATQICDVLQSELPGIEVSFSMNQQTSLRLQGFGGNSVLFLVDGERIAGETLDNIDYNRLSLDNVERIEIVKGAASSLYGSNAVGGVINIISKTSTEPWSVNLNTRFGAHNEQRYGTTVGFNAGIFNNSLSILHSRIGTVNLKNPGDYDRIFGSRVWNFKDRLVVDISKKIKLTGRVGYFFRQRDSDELIKERYRSFNGGLKGNVMFNGSNDMELSYSFDQYDKSDFVVFNGYDIRDYSNVQHSFRGSYNHTFSKNNILTVGADFMRDYLMSYQFENRGNHTQYVADIFAQFDWTPFKKFNVISGLRFDYFSETNMKHLSPKLGVMYQIGRCSLRGSYAGGFKAPTLKEMYMNFDMANIFMIYGNPKLKSESSHNFSLSVEYLRRHFNITATAFYNLVENRITTAWDHSKNGMVYINMANLGISGLDASASVKYSCGISARLSYALTYERIKKGEPLISNTRPHTATLQVAYNKSWKNYAFNISLNGRFLSSITTSEYTSLTSYETTVKRTYPAYTMWKFTFNQSVWKGIDINFIVDNIFNYTPAYYYNNSPSTTGITCAIGLSLDLQEMF